MKSIAVSYPDFHSLPKGLKSMLLLSESLFFEEAKAAPVAHVYHPQMVRDRLSDWAGVVNRRWLAAGSRYWTN